MAGELELLRQVRRNLTITFDLRGNDLDYLQRNWSFIHADICSWWRAYKRWEAVDTFDEAFQDKRMTVRTFSAGFATQAWKTFARGKIQVSKDKFFADSRYTPLPQDQQGRQPIAFGREKQKYHAQRGIDSSAFAVPANFASRETKYDAGLHDLSASLLNPQMSIFDQIHNTEEGAHFSFLPLSEMGDQEVMYHLVRLAKDRVSIPGLYDMVRNYRAQMTRVKLAYEMDMSIGYTVVPAPRPGTGPQFKLRYGLAATTSVVGQGEQPTTLAIYEARRKAARNFKSIVGIREGKNEIVLAVRQHAGPFPVYAVRRGDQLVCYTITPQLFMQRTGQQITGNGHMIPVQVGIPASPSEDTVATYDFDDPEFNRAFEQILEGMGEIPKKDGLHVVVAAAPEDPNFARIRDGLRLQVAALNTRGYKLRFAAEVDAKYKGDPPAVLVHLRHV